MYHVQYLGDIDSTIEVDGTVFSVGWPTTIQSPTSAMRDCELLAFTPIGTQTHAPVNRKAKPDAKKARSSHR